jgi:hypothetical protein
MNVMDCIRKFIRFLTSLPTVVIRFFRPKPVETRVVRRAVVETRVVRRAVHTLDQYTLERFMAAVHHMCINTALDVDGNVVDGTSEFMRLAGYHGYPKEHCVHGTEAFPGWHRLYMLDFEASLQRSDRALGEDGRIALPYWDWLAGEEVPSYVLNNWSSLPEGLLPQGVRGPKITRASQQEIKATLRRYGTVALAMDALNNLDHTQFASRGGERSAVTGRTSIEVPHDDVHIAVQGAMGTVKWAAFDILFWLHHCNVDRLYETYLSKPGAVDELAHLSLGDASPFEGRPLEKVGSGLRYRYDKIPDLDPKSDALRAPRILVAFEDVRPAPAGCSYEVGIWLSKSTDALQDVKGQEIDVACMLPSYGGSTTVFGRGNGMPCTACPNRASFTLLVDISYAFHRLGYTRENVCLHPFVAQYGEDCVRTLQSADVQRLPRPRLVASGLQSKHGCGREVPDQLSPCIEECLRTRHGIVRYSVSTIPRYLKHTDVYTKIAEAFAMWSSISTLTFVREVNNVDITISWGLGETSNLDGPGGVLGRAGEGFILFDAAECWTCGETDDEWVNGQPVVSLVYAALHEIGHLLGLQHSDVWGDIMSPYYPTDTHPVLTQNDQERLRLMLE